MVSKAVAWLRIFRAHTAVLETPLAILGAAMGLGTIWNWNIVLWIIFGIVYHNLGYGINSYADWKKGYDRDDPNKSHHPLNTGELSPDSVKYVIYSIFVLFILYTLWIGNFRYVIISAILITAASGLIYNFFGKEINAKFIPISIAHTMVFVTPYYLYARHFSVPSILIICAIFIHQAYQIGISGDIKDMLQDEASLIKNIGAYIRDVEGKTLFVPGQKVITVAFAMALLEYILALVVSILLSGISISFVAIIVLGIWMLYETDSTIYQGEYNRNERVSAMSRKEIAGIFMIAASLISIITWIGFFAIVILSMVYLLSMSQIMWSTWIRPEV